MTIHKDIRLEDWIEIKANGRTYLLAVKSLFDSWRTLNELEEQLNEAK